MNRHRYAESDTTERLNWTELNIYIHITQCLTWILVSFLCGCCSVAQLCPILRPRELQLSRLPCSSLSPRVCSDSRPLTQWCYPTICHSLLLLLRKRYLSVLIMCAHGLACAHHWLMSSKDFTISGHIVIVTSSIFECSLGSLTCALLFPPIISFSVHCVSLGEWR